MNSKMIKTKESLLKEAENAMNKVKKENPLTYCITNSVTVNDCANAVLAIGGSPIMAYNEEEVEDIINISKSLVINIGNPSKEEIKAIKKACYYGNKKNIPIIFDPVGVGISKLRNDLSLNIIQDYDLSIIRGNISEIKAIAKLINLKLPETNLNLQKDQKYIQKGVDADNNDLITKENIKENGFLVKELAKKLNTIIVASGPIDLISDGDILITINNGNEMMPKITGSGCMLSTIIGTYIGVNNPLIGAITASLHITIAGEKATQCKYPYDLGLGTFHQYLIDYLYLLKEEDISKNAKIEIID